MSAKRSHRREHPPGGENRHAKEQPARQESVKKLGEELRSARRKREITLKQVAEATHISLRHLQNLEEGRYRELPGGMYGRAFLRTYCGYLDLAPGPLIEMYEKDVRPAERPGRAKIPEPIPSPFRIPPIAVWGAMLVFSIIGLYFVRGWVATVFSPYFPHQPAQEIPRPIASAPAPPPAADPSPAPVSGFAPPAVAPGTDNPSIEGSTVAETPGDEAQPILKAPEASQTAGLSPAPASDALRLRLDVVEKSWISVNSDGRQVAVKLLEPGDSRLYSANERFYLILGNAGGVHLKINGRDAKSLGKSGQVVKLLINRQNLEELLEKAAG